MAKIKQGLIIHKGGERWWRLNNWLHRIGGPTAEYTDGSKFYYIFGSRHRIKGPAIEFSDDNKRWYINGTRYSEEKYNAKINNKY